jgi:hypothetical protein
LEEALIQDAEHRQIAIVADKLHDCRIPFWIIFLFDHDESGVADNVGVSKNSIAVNNEAGTDSYRHRSWIPRHLIVLFLGRRGDPDKALPDFNCFGNLRNSVRYDQKNYES